jgi:ribbon-helix-helix CopG family protein
MSTTAQRIYTGAQVDIAVHRQLSELARRRERSVAAEIRLALHEHLEQAANDHEETP